MGKTNPTSHTQAAGEEQEEKQEHVGEPGAAAGGTDVDGGPPGSGDGDVIDDGSGGGSGGSGGDGGGGSGGGGGRPPGRRRLRMCDDSTAIVSEMLRGANVVVDGDEGWYYRWFLHMRDAYMRISSHYRSVSASVPGWRHLYAVQRRMLTCCAVKASHHPPPSILAREHQLEYCFLLPLDVLAAVAAASSPRTASRRGSYCGLC
jgi:hypothetical protein